MIEPAPPPNEHKPRLASSDSHAALLAALPGQVVSGVAADAPLVIKTAEGWLITCEGPVQRCQPGWPITIHNGSDLVGVSSLAPGLSGARLVHAALTEEHGLWLQLGDGTGLLMPPDQQYESWQVSGPQQQRLVCGPGGKLTQWDPPAPTGIGSSEHTWQVPRKRMAASVLFTDEDDRVLLCEPTYKKVWEVPGGAVEFNESPYDAAVREVGEELGTVLPVGRLLAMDWMPPVDGRSEGVVMVYDGGRLSDEQTAAIRLPPAELRQWAWCILPQANKWLRPVVARRLAAAAEARATGTVAELEHGYRRDRGHAL